MSELKVLYGYSWFSSEAYGNVKEMTLAYFSRLNESGFNVEGFCLTLNPPGPAISFKELDKKWRRGDKLLLQMYENLERALVGKDVFINGPGINLHPEFVEQLPVFTVFQCFDDPENSENLSKPVASAYDLCLVGNIAEIDTYRSWGVRNAEWSPMGLQPTIYNHSLTREDILSGKRDIDFFMLMDRMSPWRKERLEKLNSAFPDAHFYGRGWPRGYLPNDMELEYLQRAKIGPNLHNTTGPINYRTFYLPANGVMQICDNKKHLGKIFELGKEVVGFDTIDECIELCRYYLSHDEERRLIAANGWKKVITDYNEIAVFKRILSNIQTYICGYKERRSPKACSENSHSIIDTLKANTDIVINRITGLYNAFNTAMRSGNNEPAHDNNIGDNLLEWPERIENALEMCKKHLLADDNSELRIADYGCGRQTLRRIIPAGWKYTPFDYCSRSVDTVIFNFNSNEFPADRFDMIFCMGVLEYLTDPYALLLHAMKHSSYLVLSYSGFTTQERRELQGWVNNLSLSEIEGFMATNGGTILEKSHYKNNQWIYLVKCG